MKKKIDQFIDGDSETESTEEIIQVEPGRREIISQSSDERVQILHSDVKKGRLLLHPSFQREFVWDHQKATRLIESALMEIPLPVVYLAEEENGKKAVIDGQQRLTSFFSFIDGKFPDGKIFKLGNMQVFPELKGKAFTELDEEFQDKILDCQIRSITFKKNCNADLKYNVFERLNTGSVSLNDQELRNCMYRGKFNELIKELAEDSEFLSIIGGTNRNNRMWHVELVLRYFAFYDRGYLRYKSPIKKFLNDEARDRQNISPDKETEFRKCFKNSVTLVKSLLGEKAFRRYLRGNETNKNGMWEPKKFNVSLFDILMVEFADRDHNLVMRNLDAIRESYIDMQTNDSIFIEWIYHATSSVQGVKYRFDAWRKRLDDILEADKKQKRCFTKALKDELFKKQPTCAICGQRISTVDDAAVDHIEQYWRGGKTISSNARLTHRFCNWARPRKDNA